MCLVENRLQSKGIFYLSFIYFFYHVSSLKSVHAALTSSLTMLKEVNIRNSIMNFTESLTELLRPELFPKLPKLLLGLLSVLCHSAGTVTAMKTIQTLGKNNL